jgi:hypothetical protein
MTLQVWRGRAVATSAFTDTQKPSRRCCHRVVTLSPATHIGSSARRSREISAQASHGQLLLAQQQQQPWPASWLLASLGPRARRVCRGTRGRPSPQQHHRATARRRTRCRSRFADALQREYGEHPLGCDTSTRATWHVTRCSVRAHGQRCLYEHVS